MKMTNRHLRALLQYFQADDDNLEIDGLYGPKTAAALDEYMEENPEDLMGRAWTEAWFNIGKGGMGGNNKGPYIQSLRRECGFPIDATGPWCAIFVSAMLKRAGIPIKSRGAYRLCETMANHDQGYEKHGVLDVYKVYIACWKRGRWQTHNAAHVRLVRREPVLRGGRISYGFVGGNERGDVVRTGTMTEEEFRKDLIMVAGWRD